MKRRLVVGLGALPLALVGVLALPAAPASAHPLGNFTVNQYEGLTLHPDRVEVTAVVDLAELPTRQERSQGTRILIASHWREGVRDGMW